MKPGRGCATALVRRAVSGATSARVRAFRDGLTVALAVQMPAVGLLGPLAGGVFAPFVAKWRDGTWSPLSGPAGDGTSGFVYALTLFDDGAAAAALRGRVEHVALAADAGMVLVRDRGVWRPVELWHLPDDLRTASFTPDELPFGELALREQAIAWCACPIVRDEAAAA